MDIIRRNLKVAITSIIVGLISCKHTNTEPFSFSKGKPVYFYSNVKVPVIEGTLNGKKAFFIIDSGASLSVLDQKQADKYNFNVDSDTYNTSTVAGYGGTASLDMASGVDIQIEDADLVTDFKAKDLSDIVKAIRESTGISVAGIIGSDILKAYRFTIDYSTSSVYLKK